VSVFEERADGEVILRVRAQPKAKRSAVAGVLGDALKVHIAAPAQDGKANKELCTFLGKVFSLRARQVELVGGETHRNKRVRLSGVNLADARTALGAHLPG
jgi:uncharacterized protein (TIGR00251 family)